MATSTRHIVELQQRDHARLQSLMERYERAGAPARQLLYAEITSLVTTHAFAEEVVLFPAARRSAREAKALTAAIERAHQRINELMSALEGERPGHPQFDLRAEELFGLLRDDLAREELELLPLLATKVSDRGLRLIGAAWLVVRRIAPNRPHPRVSRRPPGNALAAPPLMIYDRLRRAGDGMRRRLWRGQPAR